MSAAELPPSSHRCAKCGGAVPYYGRRDLASVIAAVHTALGDVGERPIERVIAARAAVLPAFLSLARVCRACHLASPAPAPDQ